MIKRPANPLRTIRPNAVRFSMTNQKPFGLSLSKPCSIAPTLRQAQGERFLPNSIAIRPCKWRVIAAPDFDCLAAELFKLLYRHGLAEQVALEFVATVLAQNGELLVGFNPFRDDLQAEIVGDVNDGAHHN